MPFENFATNEQKNNLPNKKGLSGKKAMIAATALATTVAGCGAETTVNSQNQKENPIIQKDSASEVAKSFLGGEYELYLKQYHNLFSGKNPKKTETDKLKDRMGFKGTSPWTKRTCARAIEIAIKSGTKIQPNSKIEFEARGNVPAQIKVDGKIVPLSIEIFTPEEIKAFQGAVSVSEIDTTKNTQTNTTKGYKSNDLKKFLE